MKIAISGKGGVGKTLLASLLSKTFAESGYSVIAIDADPAANLAATLGFPHPEEITPISEMKELIEERTGARPGESAPYFKLNPKVDDIPEKYAQKHNGIRLMRMGGIKGGGSGCYCAENTRVKALISHLLMARNEVVIMDMTAGIEHLGRATARAVDQLIVVVEPGQLHLRVPGDARARGQVLHPAAQLLGQTVANVGLVGAGQAAQAAQGDPEVVQVPGVGGLLKEPAGGRGGLEMAGGQLPDREGHRLGCQGGSHGAFRDRVIIA